MLIAYMFVSVFAGMICAGLALVGGHGIWMALLVYWLGGTLAFILTMWLAAAVYPRRWEPFAEMDLADAPPMTGDADQDKVTP